MRKPRHWTVQSVFRCAKDNTVLIIEDCAVGYMLNVLAVTGPDDTEDNRTYDDLRSALDAANNVAKRHGGWI